MHPENPRSEARTAIDKFSMDARQGAGMLDPNKPVTEDQQRTLIRDLTEYRERHLIDGKPVSWAKLAECIGASSSVLSEWVRGKYQGDSERIARKVDRFLA
ncbi:MAG TPA: hypothetical protein VNT79_10945, partial [Phycisphaerae bacterium]|nr:hypothetical protein [Phycisphaerae bacterium]